MKNTSIKILASGMASAIRYTLCFLFLFGRAGLFFSQNAQIDSLKKLLNTATNDTSRIKLLEELSNNAPDDEWIKYNEQMKLLAEKKLAGKELGQNQINFYLHFLALATNNEGFLANEKGNTIDALKKFRAGLELYQKIKDKPGIADALNNMAVIQNTNGDVSGAAESYQQSLKLKLETNDQQGIATTLNNLGNLYQGQGELSAALKYYKEGLKMEEQLKNDAGIGSSYNNIGTVYDDRRQLDSALFWYTKSIAIKEKMQQHYALAQSYNNVGVIYDKKHEFEKALIYFAKTLVIRRKFSDQSGAANTLNNIGWVKLRQEKLKEALVYSDSSMVLARKTATPYLIRNAAMLHKEIYKKQNKPKLALEFFVLEIQMRDSLYNEANRKAGIKSQLRYEYQKRAAADSVKNAEEQKIKDAQLAAQNAQIKQEKVQRYALLAGLALVLAGLGFAVNRFRVTQKQKRMIELQKVRVDKAYEALHERNKEILDSIHYAKRIQTALLPNEKYITKHLAVSRNKFPD